MRDPTPVQPPSQRLAMFPLSGVLFPNDQLSINVFEERYQRLVLDCQAGSGEFGVVLISRGSEVGGDDQRFAVGTVAQIEVASAYAEGRWLLVVRGTRRIRVKSWLDADPYPMAEVETLPEPDGDEYAVHLGATESAVRRTIELLIELGGESPHDFERPNDPIALLWKLASISPLNPIDAQRVLETDDPSRRADLLTSLADSLYEDLSHLREEQR